MTKAKIFILTILVLSSCRPEFKYNGLRVKFIRYEVERYIYSGHGWDNAYTLYFQVIEENEYYKKDSIIKEFFGEPCIKIWMLRKNLGRTFDVIKDGYALSWFLYF